MGPLHGIRIVVFQGIGPGPFCATLLSDLGAEVLRVDRITPSGLGLPARPGFDPLARGRSSVLVDLKHPDGVAFALDGILIGAGDMRFLATAMVVSTLVFLGAIGVVLAVDQSLVALWVALLVFMGARCATLLWRIRTDDWLVVGDRRSG